MVPFQGITNHTTSIPVKYFLAKIHKTVLYFTPQTFEIKYYRVLTELR